jgi:peptide/nickel transport system permease protein
MTAATTRLVPARARLAVPSRLGWPGTVALAFITVEVLCAVFAPAIAPYPPNQINILLTYAPPSFAHPLGCDALGRDILSRVIYGARISLLSPALVILLAIVASTTIALFAIWYGGTIDSVVARGFDVLYAFPGLLLAIIAVALFGPGLRAPILALAIAYLPYMGRLTRSALLRERHLPYIEACRVAGISRARISSHHLLRNISSILVAEMAIGFGFAMVDLAALSYLGLAVQPPAADWGSMVNAGAAGALLGHYMEITISALLIVATVVAFNVVGEQISGRQEEALL